MAALREICAHVALLSGARGRGQPIFDDYRPHVVLGDGVMLGVKVRLPVGTSIAPGQEGDVMLQLIYPGVDYSKLVAGAEFSILEGATVVGRGRVL